MAQRPFTPCNALIFPSGFRKPVRPRLDVTHPLSRGLVLCMPLGESVAGTTSDIASGLDGSFTGSPSFNSSHHGSISVAFSGSSQYITAPSSGVLDSLYGTWCAWIRTFSLNGGYPIFLSRSDSAAGSNFGISFFLDSASSKARAQVKGNSASAYADVSGGGALTDGKWHFVAITFNPYPGPTTLYVDGTNVSSASASAAWSFSANPFYIAGAGDSFWKNFLGDIEGVRVYGRPLADNEIQRLYVEPYAGIYSAGTSYLVGVTSGNDITVALSGVSATASPGSIAKTSLFTVPLTGSSVTAVAGSVAYSAGSDLTLSLSGSAATAAAGTLGKGSLFAIGLSGAAAAAAAGNIAPARSVGITGSAGVVSPGLIAKTDFFTIPLGGNAATASPGNVGATGDKTIVITGTAMTATAGSIAVAGADFWHPIIPGAATWTPQTSAPGTWTPQ